MLTKGQNSKFRAVKYVAMVLALVAVLAFCFTSCGQANVLSAEYLAGTLEKDQYNVGDTFDCTGAQMKVTYDNGDIVIVAVTKEMVGDVTLAAGMTYVEATYTSGVKCAIPVSVKDPLAEEKSAAIAAINAKDEVKDGDKGVAAMVAEYVNKINAAVTKDAITALSTAFDTSLKSYNDGKNAALKKVQDAKLDGLYEQFLLDVKHAQTLAIANIRAALSVDEANELAAAFENTIAKKLDEQKFYEGNKNENGAGGQIYDKVELIKLINKYIKKAENYIALIEYYNAGNMTDKLEEKVLSYEDIIAELDILKEEVRLAINLDFDLQPYFDQLITPVDEVYALIKDGHTVLPAPYAADGKTIETDLAKDPTKKLLADAEDLLDKAVEEFGSEDLVKELAQNYQYGEKPSEKIDLLAVFGEIYTKRNDLDAKQAELLDMNGKVAAWNTTDNVPDIAAIREAWATLKKYGADETIANSEAVLFIATPYAADTTKGMLGACEISYVNSETENAKSYEGIYAVDKWSGYYVTKEAVLKYYFPALQNLIDATEAAAEAADEVEDLVSKLEPIVLTHGELDAAKRLADAKTALEAFAANYKPAANDANDTLAVAYAQAKATYEAAAKRYEDLKTDRDALIELIKALGAPEEIVIKDYATDGKLAKAYAAWLAFRTFNSYVPEGKTEADRVYFTDVIDDADGDSETADDQYSAQLLDCMKKYVELKFLEEVKVYAAYHISGKYVEALDKTDPTKDTIFRSALTDEKDKLLADEGLKFNADAYAEATLLNIEDILTETLAASKAKAIELANKFVAYYNANNGDLDDLATIS